MKNISFIILILLSISFFISCEEDDKFSSNPDLRISFSSDTVRFDTVFTSFGTATKRLKVYNRNSNSLTIQSVELVSGGTSGFRMNVDGFSGTRIDNVDILKKDSVFIFLEVTVDPLNSNNPMQIRDSIRFNLNGRVQYVQLEAIGQDVIWWKDGLKVTKDTLLTAEKPFLVYDTIFVDTNAVLNIDKNVRLYFHHGAGMVVYGSLNVQGTLEEPVVFRGDRTDNLLSDVPYDRSPGQWGGVVVDSISYNNHFEHFYLRNSIKGIWFNHSESVERKAIFINSVIRNTSENGLYAVNCNIEAYNSLFANSGGSVVKLIGGKYIFTHCTLANYMSWWGIQRESALTIGNVIDNEYLIPMETCEFRNSIIAGSGSSEIKFQNKIFGTDKEIDYYFESCLIKASGKNDDQLVNIIWNLDPEFANINKNRDSYYNYELDSISPAINKANKDFINNDILRFDIRGISRLADEAPDMGCYEWIKPKEETN